MERGLPHAARTGGKVLQKSLETAGAVENLVLFSCASVNEVKEPSNYRPHPGFLSAAADAARATQASHGRRSSRAFSYRWKCHPFEQGYLDGAVPS